MNIYYIYSLPSQQNPLYPFLHRHRPYLMYPLFKQRRLHLLNCLKTPHLPPQRAFSIICLVLTLTPLGPQVAEQELQEHHLLRRQFFRGLHEAPGR